MNKNRPKDPPILRRLISQLVQDGKSSVIARRIANASLQKSGNLKPGTSIPTEQGIERGLMTPEQRAIDRAQRRKAGAYVYNPDTNRTTKIGE